MKIILAPTDYSKSSINAINYAILLAKQTKSHVLLFHAFQIPAISSEAAIVTIPFEDLEKSHTKKLKKTAEMFREKYKGIVKIDYLVQAGLAADSIKKLIAKKKIDLTVMGIKGTNKLSEFIIGSTTSTIAGNVKCPILIIPEKISFKKPGKIVFANDNNQPKKNFNPKVLKELAHIFKSKLILLTVIDYAIPTELDKKKASKIANHFMEMNHQVNFTQNKYDDIVLEINEFVKKNKANMVAMIARKHSWLERLFNERKTKKMAFHTTVPLMVLSDL